MDHLKAFRKLGIKWKNATELQKQQTALFQLFFQVMFLNGRASYTSETPTVSLGQNVQHTSCFPVQAVFSAFH